MGYHWRPVKIPWTRTTTDHNFLSILICFLLFWCVRAEGWGDFISIPKRLWFDAAAVWIVESVRSNPLRFEAILPPNDDYLFWAIPCGSFLWSHCPALYYYLILLNIILDKLYCLHSVGWPFILAFALWNRSVSHLVVVVWGFPLLSTEQLK